MVLVNADLQYERQRCTFDVKELTYIIDGGQKQAMDRKERGTLMCLCLLVLFYYYWDIEYRRNDLFAILGLRSTELLLHRYPILWKGRGSYYYCMCFLKHFYFHNDIGFFDVTI